MSSSSSLSSKQQPSKRRTTIMRHKLNSIPIQTLNKVKDKQRQQQIEKHFLHSKQRLIEQINQYDDFLTMILINASFDKLVEVTKILIQIINYHQYDTIHQLISYKESIFADYTPIPILEDDEYHFLSFRMYYNMILDESIAHQEEGLNLQEEEYHDKSQHLKMLLRSCFMIGFIYDTRIRRFVMTRHKIHYETIKTRPPNDIIVKEFINECRKSFIDPFLSNQIDIIQMSHSCIKLWIDHYMLNAPSSSSSSLTSHTIH